MKLTSQTYRVEIGPIHVSKRLGESRGYYHFDYQIYKNGKRFEHGNYDASFTVSKHAMRHCLKRGEAHRLALMRHIE